jgi:pimeloyl-ACP methyl ester carboxylesterase
LLVGALALLALAPMAAACGSAQATATTSAAKTQAAFSGRVDIGGGRKMYIQCRGSGSPTVVLISGLQIAGDLWDSPLGKSPTVFQTVAKTTRVCLYDRPGTTRARPGGGESRSDPVPQPTTPKDTVADLHALLAAARQAGPYVLVGHSYGGLIARLYAHTYPAEVVGMVLVDSLSPELRQNMTPVPLPCWLPVTVVSRDTRTGPGDLGPVIAAAVADGTLPAFVPKDFGYTVDRAWDTAQDALARLVPAARHITVVSGHNIQIDHPQVVADVIRQVVNTARQQAGRIGSPRTRSGPPAGRAAPTRMSLPGTHDRHVTVPIGTQEAP